MLHLLISILGILLTIFFVIGIHEAAHFLMARMLGVKVLRFSIGFGKIIWRGHDRKGTEYALALIPLGGYVKMLDEHEDNVSPEELKFTYNRQSFYKKFLIVLAGPITNLISAFILYWLIFMIGFTTIKPVIGAITPNSIAAKANLKPAQEILKVDKLSINSWGSLILRLIVHVGNQDSITISTLSPNQTSQTHTLNLSQWHLDALSPDPLSSLGIDPFIPKIPLIIGRMIKNSPAEKAGLLTNDKIIAINQKSINAWDELVTFVAQHPDETLHLTIERNHRVEEISVQLGHHQTIFLKKSGYLGISPAFKWPDQLLHHVQYSPLEAIPHAWQQMYEFTYFNFLLIGKLITGKISLQGLGGPITIFDSAGDALNSGMIAFISFLAFLSISIGVINLLPIPGLDGGHLFFQLIEVITRRPVPEKIMSLFYHLGFILIVMVFAIALINDMLRFIK